MIANPAMLPSMHATSTLTSGARILAATRMGVQRHRRPYSIKSRDKLAMVVASAGRANLNDSSELVMRCIGLRIAFYPESLLATKFDNGGAERKKRVRGK